MTITVDTAEYRRTHARSPRGFGWWVFAFNGAAPSYGCTGTYSEARTHALREARTHGAKSVRVCP